MIEMLNRIEARLTKIEESLGEILNHLTSPPPSDENVRSKKERLPRLPVREKLLELMHDGSERHAHEIHRILKHSMPTLSQQLVYDVTRRLAEQENPELIRVRKAVYKLQQKETT